MVWTWDVKTGSPLTLLAMTQAATKVGFFYMYIAVYIVYLLEGSPDARLLSGGQSQPLQARGLSWVLPP